MKCSMTSKMKKVILSLLVAVSLLVPVSVMADMTFYAVECGSATSTSKNGQVQTHEMWRDADGYYYLALAGENKLDDDFFDNIEQKINEGVFLGVTMMADDQKITVIKDDAVAYEQSASEAAKNGTVWIIFKMMASTILEYEGDNGFSLPVSPASGGFAVGDIDIESSLVEDIREHSFFTLKYDLQGGSGTIDDEVVENTTGSHTFTLSDSVEPQKDGLVFVGWAKEADGTSEDVITQLTVNQPDTVATVYAIYEPEAETDTLEIYTEDYIGEFDDQYHGGTVSTNMDDDPYTKIEYSTDGGNSWSSTAPTRKDVGKTTVDVKAFNQTHTTVYGQYVIQVKVKQLHVIIKGNQLTVPFNGLPHTVTGYTFTTIPEDYPGFSADDIIPDYIPMRKATKPGTYPMDIWESDFNCNNPNFWVFFHVEDGFLKITVGDLALHTWNYSGVYDGKPHGGEVTVSYPEGTVISYSLDDGKSWTTTAPMFTDVTDGPVKVMVKATNPYLNDATGSYTVDISPASTQIYGESYIAEYDGKDHYGDLTYVEDEGTIILYSIDGGVSWSEEMPRVKNVSDGVIHVIVKRISDNYEEAFAEYDLQVLPKPVTVTVQDADKAHQHSDPIYEVIVSGVIGDDKIEYTVSREPGESIGEYDIDVMGPADQGNYTVTFIGGTLRIRPRPVVPDTCTK